MQKIYIPNNKSFRRSLILACLLLLNACQTHPIKQQTTGWDDPLWQKQYQLLKQIKTFEIKGRIGIVNPADSFSSNYFWKQQAQEHFHFRMYGAFGQTYAMVKVTPQLTSLDTGDERHFEGQDAEQLLYQVLGWSLPVGYLQDWIKGLPTGVGQGDILINADGTLQQIQYLDYIVDFERYQIKNHTALPGRIKIVQGDNKVTLSIRHWSL